MPSRARAAHSARAARFGTRRRRVVPLGGWAPVAEADLGVRGLGGMAWWLAKAERASKVDGL